ncbi:response regulator [Geomonas sp.]|uniref:response regulator n=1 Tax=Geomonas sp. TaxID=2651584 RepID=UPI002B497008|nr:response regulator [Geomonas sp.]HJV34565.1 response regulator [Geomonas sp.]
MKVLLVEDDPTTRQMLSILLGRCDIPCDVAEDGFKAIERWWQGKYEVILMDVQMPELDGIEATRRIRAREKEVPKRRRVTVIAMTAHLMPEDVEECRKAGMDDLVPKPIDLERLLELIKRYGKG